MSRLKYGTLDGNEAVASIAYRLNERIIRVIPTLKFELRGIEVIITGVRQDFPPKMESIDYEIIVDPEEFDTRVELLHKNVKKYGTVFNTVSAGTVLNGVLQRKISLSTSSKLLLHETL